MAKQLLNEFADIQALETQKAKVVAMLTEVETKLKSLQGQGISLGTSAKDITTLTEAEQKVKELSKSEALLAAEAKKLMAVNTELYATEQKLIQARKESERVAKLQAQSTNEQLGAYKQLEAQAALATLRYKDLAAAKVVDAAETKKAAQTSAELNARLKEIDAQVGQNQRNVGNYKEATMSLRQEIRKLTQELARMEIAGTANSKEADIFRRKLGELKDAMGDAQNKAKFWADDARWVNTSVQAMQGLIGAYSAFNGIAALAGSENEDLQKSMQKMQALMSVMMGVQQVSNMLQQDSMVITAKNVIVDKIKAIFIKKKTEALNENTLAEVVNAKATSLSGKETEIATESVIGATGALKGAGTAAAGVGSSFAAVAAGAAAAVAALAALVWGMVTFNESQKEAKKDTEEWIKKQAELIQSIIDTRAALNGTINTIAGYITSLRNKGKTEAELQAQTIALAGQQAEALAMSYMSAGKNAELERDILKGQADAINSRKVYSKENEGLTLNEIGELNRINNAISEKDKTAKAYYASASATRVAADAAITKTTALLIAERKAAEEREKKLKALEAAQNAQTKASKELVEVFKMQEQGFYGTNKEIQDYVKSILSLLPAYESAVRNNTGYIESISVLPDKLAKVTTETDKLKDAVVTLTAFEEYLGTLDPFSKFIIKNQESIKNVLDSIQVISNAMSAYYDYVNAKETSRLKVLDESWGDQKSALKRQLDLQLITQQEYEIKVAQIDQQAADAKEKQAKKAAKRAKDMAIINATIGLAQATLQAYIAGVEAGGPAGLVTGAIYAAIGAAFAGIQLGLIIATPAYAKGRDGGKAETAIVGEQGRELIKKRTGQLFMTPDSATLTHLDAGDKVYTHSQTIELEKMLSLPKVTAYNTSRTDDNLHMVGKIDELISATKNKPAANINIDKGGISFMLSNGSRTENYINNHIRYKK
jgi:hypothetical protein